MSGARPEAAGGRLARILAGLTVLFLAGTVLLTPPHLILILNGLALAVSAVVSIAYLPVAGAALRRASPSRGDVLGAGICLAGFSDVALRLQSIVARDLGWPGIFNTHVGALSIFLGVMALVAVLWAPYAEGGRVPREVWGRGAALVAAGLAIALVAGLVQSMWLPAQVVRLK